TCVSYGRTHVFFFQAEDGIRDRNVTGVQTCALPILTERGVGTVSSEELASAAGVTSAKVRKDLSHLGSYGTRGVGYDVAYLRHQIGRASCREREVAETRGGT